MIHATFLAERLYAILEAREKAVVPLVDFVCVDDGDGPYLASWDEDKLGPTPTQAEVDAVDIAAILASKSENARVARIKTAARDAIVARYPEWKQANMTARALELVNQRVVSGLSAAEQTELDALIAVWTWIKSVREASDEAEATAGMLASDVVWPE